MLDQINCDLLTKNSDFLLSKVLDLAWINDNDITDHRTSSETCTLLFASRHWFYVTNKKDEEVGRFRINTYSLLEWLRQKMKTERVTRTLQQYNIRSPRTFSTTSSPIKVYWSAASSNNKVLAALYFRFAPKPINFGAGRKRNMFWRIRLYWVCALGEWKDELLNKSSSSNKYKWTFGRVHWCFFLRIQMSGAISTKRSRHVTYDLGT